MYVHVFEQSLWVWVCTQSCLPACMCVNVGSMFTLVSGCVLIHLYSVWLCVTAQGGGDKVTNEGGAGQKSTLCPLKETGAVNLSNYKYIILDKSLLSPILCCLCLPTIAPPLSFLFSSVQTSLSLFSPALPLQQHQASWRQREHVCLGLLQRERKGW